MKPYLYSFLFILSAYLTYGQEPDSVRYLKEVNITAPALQKNYQRVLNTDTSRMYRLQAGSLSGLLGNNSGIAIKSYGPGGLTTLSLRGSAASQAAITWNGLQLQSTMNGVYDLSLIPVFLIDETQISFGGSHSAIANASIGGTLALNSSAEKSKGMGAEVLAGAGSFGYNQQGIAILASNGTVFTKTRLYRQASLNNFDYYDVEGKRTSQKNSSFIQNGLSHDLNVLYGKHQFNMHAWYLENDKKIPPHMLSAISRQSQYDQSVRLVAGYKINGIKTIFKINGGWNREKIRFMDKIALLNQRSISDLFQGDIKINRKINEFFHVNLETAIQYSNALTSTYSKDQYSSLYSNVLSADYFTNKLSIKTGIRSVFHNGKSMPVQPFGFLSYQFIKNTVLRADISKVFRVPTLNELYWQPGGNPDLKPEAGYSASAGINYNKSFEKFSISVDGGAFYSDLKNALSWSPDITSIYHAQNLSRMQTQGFEGTLKLRYNRKKFIASILFNPRYTRSVLKETAETNDVTEGLQVIYIPKIQYAQELQLRYGKFSLRYSHKYEGYRYTIADHSAWLPPYNYGELSAGYEETGTRFPFAITITCNNIWNEDYQLIAWRAMPLQYYNAAIFIKIP